MESLLELLTTRSPMKERTSILGRVVNMDMVEKWGPYRNFVGGWVPILGRWIRASDVTREVAWLIHIYNWIYVASDRRLSDAEPYLWLFRHRQIEYYSRSRYSKQLCVIFYTVIFLIRLRLQFKRINAVVSCTCVVPAFLHWSPP